MPLIMSARCRDPGPSAAGSLSSVAKAHQAGLPSRRYYDLAYVLVVLLAFPLYWIKIVDWRLCHATDSVENDPWLIRPPSSAWVKSWPCTGGQASKLSYTLSYPGPFLRSLVWPLYFSELHFFTSFYTVIVGGLIMLAITRGSKYDMANKWRLRWAFLARAQVRAAPILVKLLRPQTPWSVAISQSLPLEGPAAVLYSVALMGPVRHQAMGAVMDVLHVSIICCMYGSSWPYAMSPVVVVMLHAACGLLTVVISSFFTPSVGRRPAAGVRPADLPRGPKAGLELHAVPGLKSGSEVRREGFPNIKSLEQTAPLPQPQGVALEHRGLTPGRSQGSTPLDTGAVVSEPCAIPPSGLVCDREQRLLSLCRRLALARAATTRGSQGSRRSRSSSDGGGSSHQGVTSSKDCGTSSSAAGAGAGIEGTSSGGSDGGQYDGALAWRHVQLKIPGLMPSDLSSGAEGRVTDAVAESCPSAVASTGVAIRAGCIEVHLDLVRGMTAPAVAGSVGAAAAAGEQGTALEEGALGGAQHAPASAEQQGLASCILQALGLPPGYDATVRAQVGTHLLTLTPAAGSGGGWAVLGTRRMQAHEVPWVTQVEPPAVVAAPQQQQPPAAVAAATVAASGDGDGGQTVALRMTVSGSVERLATAHEDGDLELLALFEGAFLKLSCLQWGLLEESSFAAAGAGGGPGAPARLMQLPPSLALSARVLTATLALPTGGRTGAISLLLMRRGTAGQSHSLLLLQPEDAAIAGEVAVLQARVQAAAASGAAADAPSTSSVASFVRDLGHWLQYRDFWRRKAAAGLLAAAAADGGNGGGPRSARLAGRLSVSWLRALMAWSRRCADGGGGSSARGVLMRLQLNKPKRLMSSTGRQPTAGASGNGVALAALSLVQTLPLSDSDLLDQDDSGGSGGGARCHTPYAAANGHAQAMYGINGAAAPLSPAMEEQQRLAQGSMPAFGQRAYQTHMRTARRVLLEFALEQQCAAVAAVLLEPAPVPQLPPPATASGAAAVYGAASYLAELAEASRAASPDRLTLLHRAVRSGDAATVDVILSAAARAADAAAAAAGAAATAARPVQSLQPQVVPLPLTQCRDAPGPDLRQNHAPTVAVVACAAASAQPHRFELYDWDACDGHGITPLHYLAVLNDGGALARHVLSTCPEALALWDVGGPDIPSPASFAAQNGVVIDTEALQREVEAAQGASGGGGSEEAAKAPETRPLFLAALWGFPCGDLEKSYQRFARARAQSGGLPTWLLLLHLVACACGLLQALTEPGACCRHGMLPLLVLQAGSFLLALLCYRPMGLGRASFFPTAAWALQALALAMLLAKSISSLPPPWPLGCAVPAAGAALGVNDGDGGGDGTECGSATIHHGLLALHHALAVVTVPYTVPYALHKVLAVQAVEVASCVLLLFAGLAAPAARLMGAGLVRGGRVAGDAVNDSSWVAVAGLCNGGSQDNGGELDLGLVWAGGAAAYVAGGSLLRSIMSSMLILAADLRARAAFVCSNQDAPPPQQPQQPQQHDKLE